MVTSVWKGAEPVAQGGGKPAAGRREKPSLGSPAGPRGVRKLHVHSVSTSAAPGRVGAADVPGQSMEGGRKQAPHCGDSRLSARLEGAQPTVPQVPGVKETRCLGGPQS